MKSTIEVDTNPGVEKFVKLSAKPRVAPSDHGFCWWSPDLFYDFMWTMVRLTFFYLTGQYFSSLSNSSFNQKIKFLKCFINITVTNWRDRLMLNHWNMKYNLIWIQENLFNLWSNNFSGCEYREWNKRLRATIKCLVGPFTNIYSQRKLLAVTDHEFTHIQRCSSQCTSGPWISLET